jgi:transposase
MPFVGLDLHRKIVQAVILSDDGQFLHQDRFPATRVALEAFARRQLSPAHRVALEATFNTWPVVELLTPYAAEIVVSNPMRTRAIAEAKVKTDRVDAGVLAHLLRLDYLPRVWTPDPQTQRMRRLTTERANLVADRTRIKNRIHAVLHHRLLEAPKGDLFHPSNLAWLKALDLDPDGRTSLDRHLRHLQFIQAEIAALERHLAVQGYRDPHVKLLMSLPGVDCRVAETLLAALGDVSRFPSADQAAAYLGLVPSTHQSAEHCYHGPITKQGRAHARWLLVQAAQHLDRNSGPLGVFFRRLMRKKNRNVAVVATARKLVLIAWHMLTRNEPYRYAQPKATQAKFAKLRIQAGGKRKKGGYPKGSKRPANYGTGQLTRAIPALDTVYADANLPPLSDLLPGEQKMIQRTGLTDFVRDLHQPKRVPRGKAKQTKSDRS